MARIPRRRRSSPGPSRTRAPRGWRTAAARTRDTPGTQGAGAPSLRHGTGGVGRRNDPGSDKQLVTMAPDQPHSAEARVLRALQPRGGEHRRDRPEGHRPARPFPRGATDLAREVKELEHEGDRFTHEIVDLVNRTFVTPFDRDDMYRLAGALDDICDHVDEAAGKIVGYGVREIRDAAKEQARDREEAAEKLAEAIGAPRGLQGLAPPAHRAARARGQGRPASPARRSRSCSRRSAATRSRSSAGRTSTRQLEEAVDACEKRAPTCSRRSS